MVDVHISCYLRRIATIGHGNIIDIVFIYRDCRILGYVEVIIDQRYSYSLPTSKAAMNSALVEFCDTVG